MRHVRWLVVLLGALSLVVVACGSDDKAKTASDGDAPPEYTITASEIGGDYKFDIPSDIAGGVVAITLDNSGNKELHDFQLVKLEDGHTVEDLVPQLADDEAPLAKWLHSGAGVGSTAPGSTSSATFELESNTEYAFFCTESSDAGVSHADHGMAGSFTTGDSSGATLPKATATISTKEYGFDVDGLQAGENTIAFTNDGEMLHHVLIAPFADGATLDDLKASFESESGEPPLQFEKGAFSAVAGIGDTIVYDVDLKPGHYALLCFLPDPGTAGPPHAVKGMVDEVTIS